MKLSARVFKDPHYGYGPDVEIETNGKRSYSFGPFIGVSDNLLGVKISLTPPFDTHSINSAGNEDSLDYLRSFEVKLSLFWIQVGFMFNVTNKEKEGNSFNFIEDWHTSVNA